MMNWLFSRTALVVGILILVGIFFLTQTQLHVDSRPTGSVEDIRALAERDDLNVLFIVIDTLRADRLGSYGYERDTSPVLDYLAESGARFENHRAHSSWTKTSMASLWTGLYPARTGVLRFPDALSSEARMPAEILSDFGFTTAGIWRNGWIAPNFGFGQGFELYVNPYIRQAPASLRRDAKAGRIDGTDIDLVLSGIEYIRTHQDERWMLYMHFMDVHQYVTVEDLAVYGNTYSDSYDHSIRWTDRQLVGLIQELDRLRLRDRTLIVVVSDHGEAFGEHGGEGHARDIHAEVTMTPWIISFPFRLESGIVVESGSENVDVWPTILDLVGAPPMDPADGQSLVGPLIGGGAVGDTEIDVAYLDQTWGRVGLESKPVIAVREGDQRLIHFPDEPDRVKLFDLSVDRFEQSNIAEEDPETTDRLKGIAQSQFEREPVWADGAPEVDLEDMDLKQLRALGYVVE